MESRENSPPLAVAATDIVTALDLERLANPLSVVHGYTQLLQRRIRGGHVMKDDELLRILSLIEGASRSIKTRLKDLYDKSNRDGEGSMPD